MSERIQKNDNCATIRRKLLTGASAFALMVSSPAFAEDGSDHPLVWIELGGNADAISGLGDRFTPPFTLLSPTPGPYLKGSPIEVQRPPHFTFGGNAAITYQPGGSDWDFSAAISYGRSNNNRKIHNQTAVDYGVYQSFCSKNPGHYPQKYCSIDRTSANYAETRVHQSERHLILDFQAGKDVGLGLFGSDAQSVLSVGVRVARFDFNSDVTIRARPEVVPYSHPAFYGLLHYPAFKFNNYYMHGSSSREFRGVGPSLSWTSSASLAGNKQSGELSFDWGINGALLFGRQRTKVHHHTTSRYYQGKYKRYVPGYSGPNGYYDGHQTYYMQRYDHNPAAATRSRNVTVPNLGANIGLSYRIVDAKLSIGYRADCFFGAMDGGIDVAKKTTLSFNGLYASISIGLGD